MANTTVGASVQVEFQSIGQMRKAIKEATSDLITMQEQFGKTSPQAIEASNRIAEMKEKIAGAKEQADLFDPGKKFQAFTTAAGQIAAGFSAVQGAMALVGNESKDLQKTLVKVQGAMALSQGLSQIGDLGKSFDALKIAAVKAFSTMRKAMMTIGIVALVAGLGLIIANFDEFKKAVFRLIPGLETVSNFVGGLVQKFTDFVGITSAAERNLEKLTKANNRANQTIDDQIKLLEAQGGKEDQIYKLKKQRGENELNNLRENLKVKGKLSEDELKKFRDLKTQQQVLDIEESNRKKKKSEDESKKLEEKNAKELQKQKEANVKKMAAQKVIEDAQLSLLVDRQRSEEEVLNKFEERKKILQAGGIKDFTDIEKQRDAELKALRDKFNKEDLSKGKEFQDQYNKFISESKLANIKDERSKEVEQLNQKYEEERKTIKENEKLSFEQRFILLATLKENERLAMQGLEDKYALEDEEKKIAKLEKEFEEQTTDFARKQAILDEEEAIFKNQLDNKLISEEEYNKQIEELSNARIKLSEAESEAKVQAAIAVSGTLGQMSKLAGEETEAGKALAIAAATIDTYTAAVAAYKAGVSVPIIGMVMGPINAALAVAAGIANINKIASVKVTGKSSGGSVSMATAPTAPAPTPTVVAQTLNTQAINQLGNQSARAYVLNSDMQNNEQRNAYLQRNARLG